MKKAGNILCVLGMAAIVFRVHYYGPWMNIAAFLCSLAPLLYRLNPLLNSIARKISDKYYWIRFWEKVFVIPIVICLMGLLFYMHSSYVHTLMAGKTTLLKARIEQEEVRNRRGGSDKYFVYYYSYSNSKYCNDMRAENSGHQLGDYFELKVSTFDPTVTELVQ